MLLMKSSVARQKARLPAALASLNNGHSSDLCACCAGVRSSSRPSFVPARPLRPRSVAWWSSLVANLSNTTPGCALAIEVEARVVIGRCRVAAMTLARSFIWPYNSSVLSRCTSSFSVSTCRNKKTKLELGSDFEKKEELEPNQNWFFKKIKTCRGPF